MLKQSLGLLHRVAGGTAVRTASGLSSQVKSAALENAALLQAPRSFSALPPTWARRNLASTVPPEKTPDKAEKLASQRKFAKPTIEEAKAMPRSYSEMSNEALLVFAASNDFGAHRERLIREIMAKDDVSWDSAQPSIQEIERANKEYMSIGTLPYKFGLVVSTTAGLASIPLCFHLDSVLWFNENFVTADVAEPKDLETWLEVGSWAWGWMEPPLGQWSFLLLCFAFARNQMINLHQKPYTDWLRNFRAQRLQKKFPQYDSDILYAFAVNDTWS